MGIAEWLLSNGFEIVADTDAGLIIQIRPPHQLADETDRILKLLTEEFKFVFDPNANQDGLSARIVGTYDPVTGDAFVTITTV